jgi:hypothetical protein
MVKVKTIRTIGSSRRSKISVRAFKSFGMKLGLKENQL